MRFASFEVPSAVLTDFVREMEKVHMQAVIVGLNDNDEVILKIAYEREEAEEVNELEDQLDELIANLPDDDNEPEDR